jgi:hypothetical protein
VSESISPCTSSATKPANGISKLGFHC